MRAAGLAIALRLALAGSPVLAQGNQCRTPPVGTSTAYCASEAFVTETAAAAPQGTVTEQKNAAGAGLTTTGNCDNTSSNAGSPCSYALTPPYFEAYLSANQTPVTDSTPVLVNINTVVKDSNSWFNTTTHLFTPQLAGSYLVTVHLRCAAAAITVCVAQIALNGTAYARTGQLPVSTTSVDAEVTAIVPLNGSTDAISAIGIITGTGTDSFTGGTSPMFSYVLAHYIGP